MIVYHYTAIGRARSIQNNGIFCGEVAMNAYGGAEAVSLTTDSDPSGHGLSSFSFVTRTQLRCLGYTLPPNAQVPCFSDKRKVRITVKVPRDALQYWLSWANKHIDPRFRKGLIDVGGGMSKARTWFISWNAIPPEAIKLIELRHMGGWVALDDYEGPWEEAISDGALRDGYLEWGDQLAVGLDEYLFERARALCRNTSADEIAHVTEVEHPERAATV